MALAESEGISNLDAAEVVEGNMKDTSKKLKSRHLLEKKVFSIFWISIFLF